MNNEAIVNRVIDGVSVVYKGVLIDNLLGEDAWNQTFEAHEAAVERWISENNAHYYERSRENFNLWEAAYEAIHVGKKIVVVEDLS